MNFELTEERQMLQDTLRRFLSDKYDVATRNSILESDAGMSADIWVQLAELGVLGALFSEDDGGFGGAGFDIAVVFEELGRAGVVEPILETCILGGGLISALGNKSQKGILETVIGGGTRLALAHGEPRSRYDLSRVETVCRGGKLAGHKSMSLGAGNADHVIISARESGAVDDKEGLSLFLMKTSDLDLRATPVMGGGMAADIFLDGFAVTDDMRLGPKGGAFEALETVQAAAITAICAQTLGGMETAVRLTAEYLQTRKQFGKPIGTFQALQHRLSDMLIEMEQARSAVIGAAGYLEADPKQRDRHASAAKNLLGRIGRMIAEDAIQMHGGIAMTQEYELAHIAKRIVMADHMFGDTDHHLERFIALSAA
ncbi:acyl-CoA dehydrogenase family protein [Planktotalea arctica]|uniref:acyl-CoA dehydrogenase family protein n=1 Tax=Planktotalea arctica TaxID=1481893 RepID=UPI003219A86C